MNLKILWIEFKYAKFPGLAMWLPSERESCEKTQGHDNEKD